VIGAVLFFALRYWGEFSSAQSFMLAVLAVIGWDLYQALRFSIRAEHAFSPNSVRISPN